jgi:hypothetical protein
MSLIESLESRVFLSSAPPTAALIEAKNRQADGSAGNHKIKVEFRDDLRLDDHSIVSDDRKRRIVQIKRLDTGFKQFANLVGYGGSHLSLVGDYRFAPPGGSWDDADVGQYKIYVRGSMVKDLDGNTLAPTKHLGTFNVTKPKPIPNVQGTYQGTWAIPFAPIPNPLGKLELNAPIGTALSGTFFLGSFEYTVNGTINSAGAFNLTQNPEPPVPIGEKVIVTGKVTGSRIIGHATLGGTRDGGLTWDFKAQDGALDLIRS